MRLGQGEGHSMGPELGLGARLPRVFRQRDQGVQTPHGEGGGRGQGGEDGGLLEHTNQEEARGREGLWERGTRPQECQGCHSSSICR